MNVAQAILALRENADKLPDPIPLFILTMPVPEVAQGFLNPRWETYQERSNQEWEEMVNQEDNPLAAAKLLMAWWDDQMGAVIKKDEEAEVVSDPYQSLTE